MSWAPNPSLTPSSGVNDGLELWPENVAHAQAQMVVDVVRFLEIRTVKILKYAEKHVKSDKQYVAHAKYGVDMSRLRP